ncbi:Methylcrotonoyl-CoA carboxylase 1 S homeolog [Oopsacas minuta]|uniref:Methylcrotonoyl-CoA carboxylase 1 S homeolog n=1 Tax=Oopsacas minuta TaxID=111878 RepID=A0AAV7JFL6_9METZ|nr:Methylcrotonoyl-CoA carboxylase 1 S homeolog [Oopsacas minuta]
MFEKVLIANRGEIACRIIKTARKMGIQSVAVFSDADRYSRHVQLADQAFYIGPSPAIESYLRMDKLIKAAEMTGATAIHPGYGFLSESAKFAEMVIANKIIWIGPPSSAIEAMGLKSISKRIMSEAGVNVIPGYHGDEQNVEFLHEMANKIGYPLMIKAVAGGGGKGMRIVRKTEEFLHGLKSCQSESEKSFGDGRVILEKYIEKPRHVEVQIFADTHGNCIHLFERDCSIQRRHQKIIEEAPAPFLHHDVRQELGQQAILAAKRVKYEGAGTVEFIMDTEQKFFFMEMNTRLQVEHPVTEMITGTDLVEWQFRVANGEKLPAKSSELICNGHSVEARIYAENPTMNFQPSPGPLLHLKLPTKRKNLRIETGVRQGDIVTAYYDPMIAKLVVWGESREIAMRKLFLALREYRISGLHTNIDFLSNVIRHKPFLDGELHTGYIEQYHDQLFAKNDTIDETSLAQSIFGLVLAESEFLKEKRAISQDPSSPFSSLDPKFQVCDRKIDLEFDSKTISCTIHYIDKNKIEITSPSLSQPVICEGSILQNSQNSFDLHTLINNELEKISVIFDKGELKLHKINSTHILKQKEHDYLSQLKQSSIAKGKIVSPPYSSTLTKVYVSQGQTVNEGDALLTLTAMKQEQTIFSPQNGIVNKVYFEENASVPSNSTVLTFRIEEDS